MTGRRPRPKHRLRNGAVAQMGERCNRTAEVRGSIPLSSTRKSAHSPRPCASIIHATFLILSATSRGLADGIASLGRDLWARAGEGFCRQNAVSKAAVPHWDWRLGMGPKCAAFAQARSGALRQALPIDRPRRGAGRSTGPNQTRARLRAGTSGHCSASFLRCGRRAPARSKSSATL